MLQVPVPPLGFTSVFLAPAEDRGASGVVPAAAASATALAAAVAPLAVESAAVQAPALEGEGCAVEAALVALGGALQIADVPGPPARQMGPVTLENDKLRLEFDGARGLLAAVLHKSSGLRAAVQLDMVYFESWRNGGAYLMRPDAQVRN